MGDMIGSADWCSGVTIRLNRGLRTLNDLEIFTDIPAWGGEMSGNVTTLYSSINDEGHIHICELVQRPLLYLY